MSVSLARVVLVCFALRAPKLTSPPQAILLDDDDEEDDGDDEYDEINGQNDDSSNGDNLYHNRNDERRAHGARPLLYPSSLLQKATRLSPLLSRPPTESASYSSSIEDISVDLTNEDNEKNAEAKGGGKKRGGKAAVTAGAAATDAAATAAAVAARHATAAALPSNDTSSIVILDEKNDIDDENETKMMAVTAKKTNVMTRTTATMATATDQVSSPLTRRSVGGSAHTPLFYENGHFRAKLGFSSGFAGSPVKFSLARTPNSPATRDIGASPSPSHKRRLEFTTNATTNAHNNTTGYMNESQQQLFNHFPSVVQGTEDFYDDEIGQSQGFDTIAAGEDFESDTTTTTTTTTTTMATTMKSSTTTDGVSAATANAFNNNNNDDDIDDEMISITQPAMLKMADRLPLLTLPTPLAPPPALVPAADDIEDVADESTRMAMTSNNIDDDHEDIESFSQSQKSQQSPARLAPPLPLPSTSSGDSNGAPHRLPTANVSGAQALNNALSISWYHSLLKDDKDMTVDDDDARGEVDAEAAAAAAAAAEVDKLLQGGGALVQPLSPPSPLFVNQLQDLWTESRATAAANTTPTTTLTAVGDDDGNDDKNDDDDEDNAANHSGLCCILFDYVLNSNIYAAFMHVTKLANGQDHQTAIFIGLFDAAFQRAHRLRRGVVLRFAPPTLGSDEGNEDESSHPFIRDAKLMSPSATIGEVPVLCAPPTAVVVDDERRGAWHREWIVDNDHLPISFAAKGEENVTGELLLYLLTVSVKGARRPVLADANHARSLFELIVHPASWFLDHASSPMIASQQQQQKQQNHHNHDPYFSSSSSTTTTTMTTTTTPSYRQGRVNAATFVATNAAAASATSTLVAASSSPSSLHLLSTNSDDLYQHRLCATYKHDVKLMIVVQRALVVDERRVALVAQVASDGDFLLLFTPRSVISSVNADAIEGKLCCVDRIRLHRRLWSSTKAAGLGAAVYNLATAIGVAQCRLRYPPLSIALYQWQDQVSKLRIVTSNDAHPVRLAPHLVHVEAPLLSVAQIYATAVEMNRSGGDGSDISMRVCTYGRVMAVDSGERLQWAFLCDNSVDDDARTGNTLLVVDLTFDGIDDNSFRRSRSRHQLLRNAKVVVDSIVHIEDALMYFGHRRGSAGLVLDSMSRVRHLNFGCNSELFDVVDDSIMSIVAPAGAEELVRAPSSLPSAAALRWIADVDVDGISSRSNSGCSGGGGGDVSSKEEEEETHEDEYVSRLVRRLMRTWERTPRVLVLPTVAFVSPLMRSKLHICRVISVSTLHVCGVCGNELSFCGVFRCLRCRLCGQIVHGACIQMQLRHIVLLRCSMLIDNENYSIEDEDGLNDVVVVVRCDAQLRRLLAAASSDGTHAHSPRTLPPSIYVSESASIDIEGDTLARVDTFSVLNRSMVEVRHCRFLAHGLVEVLNV